MKAVNIKWDVTDADMTDEEREGVLAGLPTEIEIPEELVKGYDGTNLDTYYPNISDWLSNEYGWCHYGFGLEDEAAKFMKGANTTWYDDDVAAALKYWDIPATRENISKVATPEFVDSFRQTIIQFGNELLTDRVSNVFPMETR